MTLTVGRPDSTHLPTTPRPAPYDVLLGVMCVAFGLLGLRPLSDPDVWWHLRTGDLIVHHGFTNADPWSQASTQPWVLHEWGTEVLMYLADAVAGYRGVIALHAVGMFVLAFLVARSVRRTTQPLVACLITGLSLVGLFIGTTERPQLLSWCLLAATVPALHRAVVARQPPWWFVAVIYLWANLHGLWSAALALFGALVLGLVLEVGLRAWRIYLPFVAIGAAATAVVGLTPSGPALVLAPLRVRTYAPFIREWVPPSLLDHYLAPAFILLGLVVVGWARRRSVVAPTTLCLVFAACYLGFSYTRTIPVAVIVLAPLVGTAWENRPPDSAFPRFPRAQGGRSFIAQAVLLLVVMVAVLPLVPGVQRGAPLRVSATLDNLPGRANVLNEYDLGGWLLWTARDTSPGIDGRTEIYSARYVGDYIAALSLKGDWERFVAAHHFDAAWLRSSTPLVWGLRSMGWTTLYKNDFSVVLVPPRGAS